MKANDSKKVIIFLFIAIQLYILSISIWKYVSNDFFHLSNSGKLILEDSNNLYYNTSFVKQGYKTVIQQWLYDIPLYKAYEYMGMIGVSLFTTVQYAGLIYVVYKFFKLKGIDTTYALYGTLSIPFFLYSYLNCRPQMISLILFFLQFIAIEKYRASGKKAYLYTLPLLTLLQMNVHMTFWIFHFVFLLPYLVPPIFLKRLKDEHMNIKPFIIPMILMAGSLFINPYGFKGIMTLFYCKDITKLNITEMQPINVLSEEFISIVVMSVLAVRRYRKGMGSISLYFYAGTTVLLVLCYRNSIFFCIGAIMLLSDVIREVKQKLPQNEQLIKFARKFALIAGIVICSISSVLLCSDSFLADNKINVVLVTLPEDCVSYIKQSEEHPEGIKMYTPFNYGSYFIWSGIGHIYMESKSEPYFYEINGQKDIISEYADIWECLESEKIKDFLNEYQFDYLLTDGNDKSLTIYLDTSSDYECVSRHEGKGKWEKYQLYKRTTPYN